MRANSTRIVPHPITTGAEQVMAKNAVHLTVPTETALIEAGDRTVLAAMPYRHGRVVIASFGERFQPEPGRPGWRLAIDSTPGRTTATAPDKCPYEDGPGLDMPLLRNVVAWLDEPHASGKIGQARQPFVDAHRAGLLDQFRVKPCAQLAAAMDDLIASVPEGDWKEEALWVAGESCLQQFHLPRKTGSPFYGWVVSEPRHVESRYFQRLVEQFPEQPAADWLSGDWPTANTVNYWMPDDRLRRVLPQTGRRSSTRFSKSTLPRAVTLGPGAVCGLARSCSRTAISVPPQSTITRWPMHAQRCREIVGLAPSERMLRSGGEDRGSSPLREAGAVRAGHLLVDFLGVRGSAAHADVRSGVDGHNS